MLRFHVKLQRNRRWWRKIHLNKHVHVCVYISRAAYDAATAAAASMETLNRVGKGNLTLCVHNQGLVKPHSSITTRKQFDRTASSLALSSSSSSSLPPPWKTNFFSRSYATTTKIAARMKRLKQNRCKKAFYFADDFIFFFFLGFQPKFDSFVCILFSSILHFVLYNLS